MQINPRLFYENNGNLHVKDNAKRVYVGLRMDA